MSDPGLGADSRADHPVGTVLPAGGDAPWRHIAVSVAAAAALIGAAVVGVIALRNDSGPRSIVNAPPAPATAVPPSQLVATIDLAAAVARLEPTQVFGSYPIAPPGDLHPTAYATPASGDRIAVLDDVSGVVRFIDGTTRMDITQYPTHVPTIGSPSFIAGSFLVGPDDVLYVNEGNADPGQTLVAYGRTGDSYVEIGRTPHGVGDGTLALGRTGITVIGGPDAPMMRYVGIDGQPSGATIDVDNLTITSDTKDVYTLQRADRGWTVTYIFPPDAGLPPSDVCVLCPSAYLGPNNTVVLINRSPTPDGDLQTKLTLLADQITTYDTDWNYIGTLDGKLLFDRLDQDSIDIGTIQI